MIFFYLKLKTRIGIRLVHHQPISVKLNLENTKDKMNFYKETRS